MYQRNGYFLWVEAMQKSMIAFSEMRQDKQLAEKIAAHAAKCKKKVLIGDVFASYICSRCGADTYCVNGRSISLKFGDLIADVLIPDEIIDLIENAMSYMIGMSLESCVRMAGKDGRAR